jgi:amino acid transporter
MWEFTATNQNTIQQLSALVAAITIALVGVAILLVPTTYKNVKKTLSFSTISEKRQIFKLIYLFYTMLVIVLFITNFFGVYAPSLFQTAGFILFLLIFLIWAITILLSKISKRNRNPNPSPIKRPLPVLYLGTLVGESLSIFFCILSLFSATYPMLGIEISPLNQDNYIWARWFLVDGITFFFMAIIYFSLTHFSQIIHPVPQDDEKKKKIPKGFYILLAILFCALLSNILVNTLGSENKYENSGTSFVRDIFFVPLEMKAHVSINSQYLMITNESNFDWQNVTIMINEEQLSSGYTNEINLIGQNKTHNIEISEFAKFDGTRFNLSTMKPLRISVKVSNSTGRSGKLYGILVKVNK